MRRLPFGLIGMLAMGGGLPLPSRSTPPLGPSLPPPTSPLPRSTPTRQTMRAKLFQQAVAKVNRKNLREVGESHFVGMSRNERRNLARAYASKAWSEIQAKRAA